MTEQNAEDPGTRHPGLPLTACSAVASRRWEKHEDAGPVSNPSAESGSPGDWCAGSEKAHGVASSKEAGRHTWSWQHFGLGPRPPVHELVLAGLVLPLVLVLVFVGHALSSPAWSIALPLSAPAGSPGGVGGQRGAGATSAQRAACGVLPLLAADPAAVPRFHGGSGQWQAETGGGEPMAISIKQK